MVSHFTQNKAKVILGAHRALYDLPFSLIGSFLLLFFSCSSLTSLLAEPFLNPFTGWLFYWDPHILMTITPTSFESRFSCHLLNKVHPDHCPHENLNVKPHLTCFLFFSRGSSGPRDWTWVSCVSCIGRRILYHWTTREALAFTIL